MWGGRRYSLKGIGEGEEAVDERFEQPRSATKWRRRVVARRCDENMTSFLYSVTCVRVHVQYTYSTALDHLRTFEGTFVRRYEGMEVQIHTVQRTFVRKYESIDTSVHVMYCRREALQGNYGSSPIRYEYFPTTQTRRRFFARIHIHRSVNMRPTNRSLQVFRSKMLKGYFHRKSRSKA